MIFSDEREIFESRLRSMMDYMLKYQYLFHPKHLHDILTAYELYIQSLHNPYMSYETANKDISEYEEILEKKKKSIESMAQEYQKKERLHPNRGKPRHDDQFIFIRYLEDIGLRANEEEKMKLKRLYKKFNIDLKENDE